MAASIALRRLCQQGIAKARFGSPVEVVEWLGAVQAQDYPGAKWSLGMRMQHATDDAMDQAFNEGRILRTHLMRPTWHFVTPTDIRWIQQLTNNRVRLKMTYNERRLDLDEAVFSRCNPIIADALRGGVYLTREELGQVLARAGIAAEGLRLGHMIMHAELDAVICSGPRRGKQFTYALLEERAPQAQMLERDAALAELTRRYFTGHGPATPRDFSWWSGLTIADAREGIAMLGAELEQAEVDGQTYWFSAAMPPDTTAETSLEAVLLPTYDEFLVGYDGFDKARRGGDRVPAESTFYPSFLIGDAVAGRWQRTVQKGGVSFEIAPFSPLTSDQRRAVDIAAQRYADFLGLPVVGPPSAKP